MFKDFKKKRRFTNGLMHTVFAIFSGTSVIVLLVILTSILLKGVPYLSWDFLANFPSRHAEDAGILPSLIGSLMIVAGSMLIATPIGIATALYLEEYAKSKRIANILQTLIFNLAGVPSIVYGIFGVAFFVMTIKTLLVFMNSTITTGRVLLAGILTMSILILPVIVVTTQEALKTVPKTLKQASLALGATDVQTSTKVTLKFAFPNILTGIILAIARVLGETAPLLMVGAAGFITFIPTNLLASYTVLPVQIYNWMSRPQIEFQSTAAAGIIVLLLLQLLFSGLAIFLRAKLQKRYE